MSIISEEKYIENYYINVIYLGSSLNNPENPNKTISKIAEHINLTVVNTKSELLELLEKNDNFDLLVLEIFSDNKIPSELITEIRCNNTDIPFIVLMDKSNKKRLVDLIKLGASDCINKSDNFLEYLENSIERVFLQSKLSKNNQIDRINDNESLIRQESFREIAENVGIVFWVTDTKANKITYVSPSYESLTERKCNTLYENIWSWYELIPPEELEVIINKLRNRDKNKDNIMEFIHRIILPSGKIKWVKTESHFMKDQEGKVNRVIGSLEDITKFKETEFSLLNTSEKLNFLITGSPVVIYSGTDLVNSGATFISDNVYDLMGYKSEDIIGNNTFWFDNIHPDDRNKVFFRLPENYDEENQIYEYRFLHANGTYIWLQSELRLIKKENNIIESIGYLIDITERKISEISLKKVNEQITTIFSNLKETYFTKDLVNNIFTYFTDSCENVYGYTKEDFYKNPDLWFRVIYKDDLTHVKTFMEKLYKGVTVSFEHRIINSDGEIVWIREKVNPILDSEGLLVRIDGIASNITEQKIAEERLRESQDLFRNSFDHAAIGMLITNIDGKFLQVNDSYCKMLGYSEQELLTIDFANITHKEDLDLTFNSLKSLLEGEVKYSHYEKRYIHKSGAIVWARVNITLNRDKDGNPLYFITQIENITDRKLSEAKLIEQAALLDITTDAILLIDSQYNIIFWNKGAEKLYDYKKEEAIGQNITKIVYGLNLSYFDNALKIVLKNSHWNGELEHTDKSGKKVIISSTWTLMKDSFGNPLSILIVNTDITQKKYLEKEYFRIQRLDSIGTLTAGIAHDLNNILTPIMMGIEILKASDLNEDKKQRVLNNVGRSTRQGVELIKRMLMFSRGDEANFQKINIKELLNEIAEIIKDTFPKSINLKMQLGDSISKVMADNTQLNQLFMNLCINARDAMPKGGNLTIKVENVFIDESYANTHPAANVRNYVLITIDDSGVGIPQESIDKIFEPFFTTKEIGKGTGLGLSTSNLIIKNHKGFINVYSEVGNGTSFKIYLPAITENENDNVENNITDLEILSGSGELILVVDDELYIREITKETLETFGYKALLAADGPEAINLYVQHESKIKAVLMDINMPLMDGLSTINALNKIDNNIKIIGMSGLSSNKNLIKDLTSYFLEKPFTTIKLLRLISEVINSENISLEDDTHYELVSQPEENISSLEDNKLKSEFLATISHEILTPMNGVIGMTNLLRQTDLTPEQKAYIDTIEKSEKSLLTVINDILDFSKIESKVIELKTQDFELKSCIEKAFATIADDASGKNINLIYDINSELPRYVKGDLNRIVQVLSHLFNNGVKFMEKGKLYVSVDLLKKSNNILTLKFLVKDDGIGINDSTINKLFQPFTESDSSNKRKYGSSGIGLALCKKLIELMDGSIWVKSEIGIGSEFHFTINLAESEILPDNKNDASIK